MEKHQQVMEYARIVGGMRERRYCLHGVSGVAGELDVQGLKDGRLKRVQAGQLAEQFGVGPGKGVIVTAVE